MLMNLKTLEWDETCLKHFGIRRECLAEIVSNCQTYGEISSGTLKGVEICGMIGDQQGALVGQKVGFIPLCIPVSFMTVSCESVWKSVMPKIPTVGFLYYLFGLECNRNDQVLVPFSYTILETILCRLRMDY